MFSWYDTGPKLLLNVSAPPPSRNMRGHYVKGGDQLFSISPEFHTIGYEHKLHCEGFGQRMRKKLFEVGY